MPCLKTIVDLDGFVLFSEYKRKDFDKPSGSWFEENDEIFFVFDDCGWVLS